MKTLFTFLLAAMLATFTVNAQSALLDSIILTDLQLGTTLSSTHLSYDENDLLNMHNTAYTDDYYYGSTELNQSFVNSPNGDLESVVLQSLGGYYGDLELTLNFSYGEDTTIVVSSYSGGDYEDVEDKFTLAYDENENLTFYETTVSNANGLFFRDQFLFFYNEVNELDSIISLFADEEAELEKVRALYYTYTEGKITKVEKYRSSFGEFELTSVDSLANYVGDNYTYRKTKEFNFMDITEEIDSIILDDNNNPIERHYFFFESNGDLTRASRTEITNISLNWNSSSLSPLSTLNLILNGPLEQTRFNPRIGDLTTTEGYAVEKNTEYSLNSETLEYDPIVEEKFIYNQPSSLEKISSLKKIEISPNPTSDRLIFHGMHGEHYIIYDTEGRIVQTGSVNSGEVDVTRIIAGNYIIKVVQEDGRSSLQGQFIKL